MIHVEFREPKDPEWRKWQEKSRKATEELIQAVEAGAATEILEGLYKLEKRRLMEVFHGKCAYCEVKITGSQPGDVEHFRPKKEVHHSTGDRVMVRGKKGEDYPHPGYYWLAYDWRNLLPACRSCNCLNTQQNGTVIGKGNKFPLKPGYAHASNHQEDHTREKPLLLNPLFDNPEEHLELDGPTGLLTAKTEEGQVTIDILGLNREGPLDQRRDAFKAVTNALIMEITMVLSGADQIADEHTILRIQHETGKAPFAMAGRKALQIAKNRLLKRRSRRSSAVL